MLKSIKFISSEWSLPLILISLLVLTRFNLHYLVFHSFAEYFAVFVGLAITLVTYYTYTFTKNRYLLFIGLGYFWVAILDVMHTQTYVGMSLYHIEDSNTSTSFWILARIFEATILLTAPFMRHREYKKYQVSLLFAIIVTIIISVSMNSPLKLFVEGEGLTQLKVNLEYFVIAILLLTLYINKIYANEFSKVIRKAMSYSIILTILAEISFTLYIDLYGVMNVIGHSFKFLSFWILLQAIIKTSLEEPFKVMKQSSTTYDVIAYPAIVVDNDGIVRQVNRAACEVIGKDASDIVGFKNHNLYHPKDIDENECPVCLAIANSERLKNCELEDKQLNTVTQYSLNPIESKEDNIQGMVQVGVDVTYERGLKDSLSNQYKLLQHIVDTVPIRIFWKDKDSVYRGGNNLFIQDARLNSADELIGKNDFELTWSENEAKIYVDDDREVMNSGEAKLQFEETQTTSSGETITVSTSKVPLRDISGEIVGVVGAYEDITKRKEIERKLEKQKEILKYQAYYDALTNLPNRILLQDRLTHAIERSKRNVTQFALLFIDIDQFKQINDTLGHGVGDSVLKIFSTRLKKAIRQEDTLARLGGDEFTVLLEDIQSIDNVSRLVKKIMDQTISSINIDKYILYITISIGISIYPKDSTNAEDLLKYADSAMYKAKDEGRNNFQFYSSELTQKAMKRAVIHNDLRKALENEEFEVYYQPQVKVSENVNSLIGFEALVRWNHPKRGLISPIDFIPLAEETGMIVELDRLVMKIAITQANKWNKENEKPIVLSLNLAMKQLQQDDFIPTIKKIMEDIECKECLAFEITESDLMKNPEYSIEKLNKMQELGFKIAIDDFGTGYSSLSYLKRLPISKLKIDKSFIDGLPDDKDDTAIVKAIISLAQNLNIKIIAEGVETEEQKNFMYKNGCDEIQGYLYSKPMSSKETKEFILTFK